MLPASPPAVEYGRKFSETPSSSSSCADGPITVSFGIGPSSSLPDSDADLEEDQNTPKMDTDPPEGEDRVAFAAFGDEMDVHQSDTQVTLHTSDSAAICVTAHHKQDSHGGATPMDTNSVAVPSSSSSASNRTFINQPLPSPRPATNVKDGGRPRDPLPSQQQPSGHYVPPPIERDIVDLTVRQDSFFGTVQNAFMIQRLPPEDEVQFRKPPKVVHHYLFGDVLGEGSYGKVKECLHERTLRRYAIKILKLMKLKRIPGGLANVEREICILKRLDHPNVIRLHEVFRIEEKRKWYLVLDFAVSSIQEMLDHAPGKRFPVFQAHLYFKQLICGLEYLHGAGVIHKDIKPGNLLLALDETLKITDFGVAGELDRFAPSDLCNCAQGTPKFQPPEIASGKSDSFRGYPVDIWAAGVTLYNLVSGEYPFDGTAILPLYNNIVNSELLMPKSVQIDETLEHLLRRLLNKLPDDRINIDAIRAHAWFKRKHANNWQERVPITRPNTDSSMPLTVYPFLEMLYGSHEDISMHDHHDCHMEQHERDCASAQHPSNVSPVHASASACHVQENSGHAQTRTNSEWNSRSHETLQGRKHKSNCIVM